MTLRIGLDLDNTIINYDQAFLVAAKKRKLIPPAFEGSKQQIRDYIRTLNDINGETEWQALQGFVYGKGIMDATLFPGVIAFLHRAKVQGAPITVISHKTQFGHFDDDKVDLREAAIAFLQAQGVLAYIPREKIFFCTTREEKIEKITALLCDVFVDDLEEVLGDKQFPAGVRKVLFATVDASAHPAFENCSSWPQIEQRIFEDDIHAIASEIIKQKVDSITLAGGGGNSRIYRVIAKGKSYALKMYPKPGADTRDRLGIEKQALQFFEAHGIECIPRWLGDKPGYGMLSWADGVLAIPPLLQEIEQAAAFIENIKHLSTQAGADTFPPASEACLSAQEILRQIERRLARLQDIAQTEPALKLFLEHQFVPALQNSRTAAEADYARRNITLETPLYIGKCLIPADFGFHNAMRTPHGELLFIDFEYFGWDDPVKLVADFLLHPAYSLTADAKELFKTRMHALFADDPHFAHRLSVLTPLFALRWALILLNEFLPERWSGRAFARGENEWAAAKERQLAKADDMVKNNMREKSDA